jgi:hypothetical protein
MSIRAELGRLILAGLNGRSLLQLFAEVRRVFKAADQRAPAWDTFTSWVAGECFPQTQLRQDLLGDAVGGSCGVAIKLLHGKELAFRSYRYLKQKTERIRAMTMKAHAGHGLKAEREFAWVSRPDESGRHVGQLQIMCGLCHATYHFNRRGKLEAKEYFTKKGWEVGKSAVHDVCPDCVAARKVVKMTDHKKPPMTAVGALLAEKEAAGAPVEKLMGPSERRLLSRFIEDHWDDHPDIKAYRTGWNDVRIGKEYNVPLDWVKKVRAEDFGEHGEDPGVANFLAEQVKIRTEQVDLSDMMKELMSSVVKQNESFGKINEEHNKMLRTIAAVQQKQGGLAERVRKLSAVAENMQRPFDKAG